MKGKLKTRLRVGRGETFDDKGYAGKVVEITDTENHLIYGKRYKVLGFDDWFEANCFEYIDKEIKP